MLNPSSLAPLSCQLSVSDQTFPAALYYTRNMMSALDWYVSSFLRGISAISFLDFSILTGNAVG
jgi:hypothetical protein